MWFNNLLCYRFSSPFTVDAEQLETALQQDVFRPCNSQEVSTFGWAKPLGKKGELLHHAGQRSFLVCAKKEEKVIPGTVVKEALDDKVAQVEAAESRPVRKKEKQQLKEDIIAALLPRAFSKSSTTFAFIDLDNQYIIVNSGSFGRAEDLLALLRKSLGSLPVLPVFSGVDIATKLTSWLKQAKGEGEFILGQQAELKDLGEDAGTVTLKNQQLDSDEVQLHIENHKFANKVELIYADRISFTLQQDGIVKRLKATDTLKEQAPEFSKEEWLAKFDSDFALMQAEFHTLLQAMFATFGANRA